MEYLEKLVKMTNCVKFIFNLESNVLGNVDRIHLTSVEEYRFN